MAVVINDFEVVTEPPPGAERVEEAAPAAQPAAPTAHDIELINRHLHERAARVRAD